MEHNVISLISLAHFVVLPFLIGAKHILLNRKLNLNPIFIQLSLGAELFAKKTQTIRRRPIFKSQMVLKILIVVVNNSLRKMQNVFLLGDTYLNILHYSLSREIIRRKHLRRFVNNIPKSGDINGPNFT